MRYKLRDILKALERKERVTIMYHGKKKDVIVPASEEKAEKVREYPFFGMLPADVDVNQIMEQIRGGRYRAF